MDLSQYISNYLDFYASSTIIKRGKSYLKSIQDFNYDDSNDSFLFTIKGTKTYKVKIQGLKNKNLNTSCTCPYSYGAVCKHIVAALLYINQNKLYDQPDTLTNPTQPVEMRRKNESITLPTHTITHKLISDYTAKNIRNNWKDFIIESIDIEGKKIIFRLKNNFTYYYYNDKPKYETVTVEKTNDGLKITSTESKKVPKGTLKPTECTCLYYLYHNNISDFFKTIFDEKKQLIDTCVETFGIPKKDFDKYFEIKYNLQHNKLTAFKKTPAKDLIPIRKTALTDSFSKILEHIKEYASESNLPAAITNKKTRTVAFVIIENDTQPTFYLPIVGKENKAQNAIIARIEPYTSNITDAHITPEQEEIIRLIQQYDDIVFQEGLTLNTFNLSKQIFHKLQQQKYVFINYEYNKYIRSKKDLIPIKLSEQTLEASLSITETPKYIKANIVFGNEQINFPASEIKSKSAPLFIINYDGIFYHLSHFNDYVLFSSYPTGFKTLKKYKNEFLQNAVKPLAEEFKINLDHTSFKHETYKLDYQKEQVFLSEKDDYIVIYPQVVYDNNISILLTKRGNYLHQDQQTGKITIYERNTDLENDFIEQLAELHPKFQEQKHLNYFYLTFEEFTENLWFYHFFDRLNDANIEVFGLKDLKKFNYSPHKGQISTSIRSGQDWFDVNINVEFGNQTVDLNTLKKAIIKKDKYIQLKDGSVGILPEEWVHKLEKYFRAGEIKKDKLSISKLKFSIVDELFDNIDDQEVIQEIARKKQQLARFKEISDTPVPKEIKATLRNYQKEGLNWLNFLHQMQWGGILADDMGLGKTLQILTFIQHIAKQDPTPNLIVVPTSLLFNWQNELQKFAPKLKAYFHYGNNRKKDTAQFNQYHLIFTTYGVLLRDIELLHTFPFNYIILDESQAIKNPASRRYKAANLIKAKNRIALTGTPIENSTFDLFAQMNFVNPGIFGSINNFKTNYSDPIDKQGNELIAAELQKIINPFVLRRTKEKVAQELPPKTEDILYCQMEPEQQKIYNAYRDNYRQQLLDTVEKKGLEKSKLIVLKALTRLRQICDSPQLLDDIDYNQPSTKIQVLLDHITQKTAQHKILIFSQFTAMLQLIKTELQNLNIPFEYLDGQCNTKQRQQSVNNFQNNPNLRIFLISLKAGGTGLNLTAADYVYIVDPWWNPAVENQAIDRCYRIGQDKKVFAYRMICKDTIEEKILNLQEKKKKLASNIIHTDENMIKNLTINDLKHLFS